MDQTVLQKLDQLEKIINRVVANMATKDDLKSFATKDDQKDFATKDDLKSFATKDDLKKELENMREIITKDLAEVTQDFANSLDRRKADKTQFNYLHDRVSILEEKMSA